ncbi:hypothetical protein [Phaffia rhodozyma]|uniref:Uncharacterized protein n=1 Tax=Phaffia rhodozyma TaxID=264483 RepID=A0A0F7SU17_PHARH|nr:hypothetical protein [Phaffia rhodozyma]
MLSASSRTSAEKQSDAVLPTLTSPKKEHSEAIKPTGENDSQSWPVENAPVESENKHIEKRSFFGRSSSHQKKESLSTPAIIMRFAHSSTPTDGSLRIRVFMDHPTAEPLYVNIIPGVDSLHTLKRKILTEDNTRFLATRQNRKSPIEVKWDIPEFLEEEPTEDHYDFDNRLDVYKISCSWIHISKMKRTYDHTKVFHSILSSYPSNLIVAQSDQDAKVPLDLGSIFPPDTPEMVEARAKGLTELAIRIKPQKSWPILVAFSDVPTHPFVVEYQRGMRVRDLKVIIGEARTNLIIIMGDASTTTLDGSEFFLFKCAQPGKGTSPRTFPNQIDRYRGLTPATLFDDEEVEFASHRFMRSFRPKRGNNPLEKVELVAFMVDDMEEDLLNTLSVNSKAPPRSILSSPAEQYAGLHSIQTPDGSKFGSSRSRLSYSEASQSYLTQPIRRSSAAVLPVSRTDSMAVHRESCQPSLQTSATSSPKTAPLSIVSTNMAKKQNKGPRVIESEEFLETESPLAISDPAELSDSDMSGSNLDILKTPPIALTAANDHGLRAESGSDEKDKADEEDERTMVNGYALIEGALFSLSLKPIDRKGEKLVKNNHKGMFSQEEPLFSVTPVHVG